MIKIATSLELPGYGAYYFATQTYAAIAAAALKLSAQPDARLAKRSLEVGKLPQDRASQVLASVINSSLRPARERTIPEDAHLFRAPGEWRHRGICSDSEPRFALNIEDILAQERQSKGRIITRGDEPLLFQKTEGAYTGLILPTKTGVYIDGVHWPEGTIVSVGFDDERMDRGRITELEAVDEAHVTWMCPLRLSAFAVPTSERTQDFFDAGNREYRDTKKLQGMTMAGIGRQVQHMMGLESLVTVV